MELDVERAGIFKNHSKIEGLFLDPQGSQRGIPKLAKTPFIGVRNEGNLFRLKDLVDRIGGGGFNFPVRDQPAGIGQFLIQTRFH